MSPQQVPELLQEILFTKGVSIFTQKGFTVLMGAGLLLVIEGLGD